MKQLIGKLYFSKKNVWDAILMNLLFVACYTLLFDFQFEQDDGSMAQISYSHDEHLVFINIIIGLFLKGLLTIFPEVPWYFILELTCIFVSFTVITYFLILKEPKAGKLFAVLFLLTFGYNAYVYIQFTKTAVLLTLAGILIILNEFYQEKLTFRTWIFSFFCLLLGKCYRANGFYLAFACAFFFLVYTFFSCVKEKNKIFVIKFLVCNGVILLICLSTTYINNLFYHGPEWDFYKEYNSYRSTLLDYGFPDYEENMDLYQSVGLSEEDITLYKGWNFADTELFNLDTVKPLANAQRHTQQKINFDFFVKFFRDVSNGVMQYHWIGAYLLTILGICIFVSHPILWLAAESISMLLVELYLYNSGRILLNRVQFGIFFSFMLVNMMILLENGFFGPKKSRVFICGVCIILVTFQPDFPNHDYKWNYQLYELEDSDLEHLYLNTSSSKALGVKSYLWEPPSHQRMKKNSLQFGSWTTYLPVQWETYQKYQVTNMFRDMINNSTIYLNDASSVDAIINYVNRHYDSEARLYVVKKIDNMKVYRVLSNVTEIMADHYIYELPPELEFQFHSANTDNALYIDGYAFLDGKSSYQGNAFAVIKNDQSSVTECLTLRENVERIGRGDEHGAYSSFSNKFSFERIGFIPETVEIIYEYHNVFYHLGEYPVTQ